jgi:hypothetical protein
VRRLGGIRLLEVGAGTADDRGFQLVGIADLARKGLPIARLLAEGDPHDGKSDIPIGSVDPLFLRRRQMLEDADDDIVGGNGCPGRQADAKDQEADSGGHAVDRASLCPKHARKCGECGSSRD